MKKMLSFLVSRAFIVGILLLFQLAFLVTMVYYFGTKIALVDIALRILSYIMVVIVINNVTVNPTYKIAWIIVILAIPLVGGVLYMLFGNKRMPKQLLQQQISNYQQATNLFVQDEEAMATLAKEDKHIYNQFAYLWNSAFFPTHDNSSVKYYNDGEKFFWALLEDLKKAEKFIFMEYFIIEAGLMWDSILEVLKEKVKAGVEVRFMYDDGGSLSTLPINYVATLKSYGINAKAFNPVRPLLAIQMNNRDHRKITVIDGKIAYTGGMNLADEYINKVTYYGHWRDGGIRMEGDAVFSFTVMFLQMFQSDFSKEVKDYFYDHPIDFNDAVACPFSDSPTDEAIIGESVHLNIINNALEYVYVTTPYLILDQEMTVALTLAAKRGVDVRIVVPFIPDKWYAQKISQANYYRLVRDGVKIYEYLPGFMHAKNVVADDNIVCVGTINMDFRSYYLHFECGVLIHKSKCIIEIRDDILAAIEQSRLVTQEDLDKESIVSRLFKAILNILAPMM